jgi:hypothetical protein
MVLARGFVSSEHASSFAAGRQEHHRGGSARRVCGARTRGRGLCQQPPLAGHNRCIRHAGPKAARELRQRQIGDLAAGRISPVDFERYELRRAANRLRDAWKRNPWLSGATIDLGPHEDRFQIESGLSRLGTTIPPAVLDWLRWRYRRLQIDQQRDAEWSRVVYEEYPRRVRAAGPPPPEYDTGAAGGVISQWTVDAPMPSTKRARADVLRLPPAAETAALRQRAIAPDDEQELVRIAYEQRDVLGPLLGLCRGVIEQRSVIFALKEYLGRPGDLAALKDWLGVVSNLRART